MLSFVKINENGGIWANRDEALSYMAKGYKVYTDTDESVELTEDDLLAISQKDTGGRVGESVTVTVAAGAEG